MWEVLDRISVTPLQYSNTVTKVHRRSPPDRHISRRFASHPTRTRRNGDQVVLLTKRASKFIELYLDCMTMTSNPRRGNRFFSTPKRPDHLWGPSCPPVQRVRTFFSSGGKGHGVMLTTHLLRWSHTYTPSIFLHGLDGDNFNFLIYRMVPLLPPYVFMTWTWRLINQRNNIRCFSHNGNTPQQTKQKPDPRSAIDPRPPRCRGTI